MCGVHSNNHNVPCLARPSLLVFTLVDGVALLTAFKPTRVVGLRSTRCVAARGVGRETVGRWGTTTESTCIVRELSTSCVAVPINLHVWC